MLSRSNVAKNVFSMRCRSSFREHTVTEMCWKQKRHIWLVAASSYCYQTAVTSLETRRIKSGSEKSDMSSDLKLRVKVCGVNISWVAWASTVQCSVFRACLPACLLCDWVFWAIKSCCWPDDEEPDALIVSGKRSVHLYKGRPQLDTRETLSNWPGTIFFFF